MLIEIQPFLDGLTIFKIKTKRLRNDILRYLDRACDGAKQQQRHGILLDFSNVKSGSFGAIGGVIEVIGRHPRMEFALCSVGPALERKIRGCGLDRHIILYPNCQSAANTPRFQKFAMTHGQTVISITKARGEIRKKFGVGSIAELDVLGRSLLTHTLCNLNRYGVRDVILDGPEPLLRRARQGLDRELTDELSLFLAHQSGNDRASNCFDKATPFPLSDVTKSNLVGCERALFYPLNGLFNLNLASLLGKHTSSGCDHSIFGADHLYAQSDPKTSMNCIGTPISKPHLISGSCLGQYAPLQGLVVRATRDISAQSTGAQKITANTPMNVSESASDFLTTLRFASKGVATNLTPNGEQIDRNVWRAQGAQISPHSRITGFCYAGASSTIEAEAHLTDFVILGAKSKVLKNARLSEAVLLEGAVANPDRITKEQVISKSHTKIKPVAKKENSSASFTQSPQTDLLERGAA